MENASKALLMAAGILMGILVLSLIVYIYATFSDSTQKNIKQMELNSLTAFNSKYLSYDGREDLTYYDIANVATMARNDNKNNEEQVYVLLMREKMMPGATPNEGNSPESDGHLSNLNISSKYYDNFINRINNVEDFDDSSDGSSSKSKIMEDVSTIDPATGETKPARVLVKYKCVVKISEETGRVNEVNFYRLINT